MTPIYQYPSTNQSGISALSGALEALGGGMMEIEAAKKSQQQMYQFADILEADGAIGDAKIYRSMAAAEKPNFLQAAITGQPTKRDTSRMADHALKILQDKRDNDVKLRTSRDPTLTPNISLLRSQIGSNNSRISQINNELAEIASKLPNAPDGTVTRGLLDQRDALTKEKAALEENSRLSREEANNLLRFRNQQAAAAAGGAPFSDSQGNPKTYDPAVDNSDPNAPALPVLPAGVEMPGAELPVAADPAAPSVTEKLPRNATSDAFAGTGDIPMRATPLDTAVSGAATAADQAPEVVAANERLQRRVTADRAIYGDAYGATDPQTEVERKARVQKLQPQKFGDGIYSSEEEAFEAAKKHPEMNFSVTPDGKGNSVLRFSSAKGDKGEIRSGTAYKNPDSGIVYYVEDNKLYTRDGSGKTTVDTYEDKIKTAAKMREIIESWNTFNPTKPMVLLGNDLNVGDLPLAQKSPLQTNSTGGQGTGSKYVPATQFKGGQ